MTLLASFFLPSASLINMYKDFVTCKDIFRYTSMAFQFAITCLFTQLEGLTIGSREGLIPNQVQQHIAIQWRVQHRVINSPHSRHSISLCKPFIFILYSLASRPANTIHTSLQLQHVRVHVHVFWNVYQGETRLLIGFL